MVTPLDVGNAIMSALAAGPKTLIEMAKVTQQDARYLLRRIQFFQRDGKIIATPGETSLIYGLAGAAKQEAKSTPKQIIQVDPDCPVQTKMVIEPAKEQPLPMKVTPVQPTKEKRAYTKKPKDIVLRPEVTIKELRMQTLPDMDGVVLIEDGSEVCIENDYIPKLIHCLTEHLNTVQAR